MKDRKRKKPTLDHNTGIPSGICTDSVYIVYLSIYLSQWDAAHTYFDLEKVT